MGIFGGNTNNLPQPDQKPAGVEESNLVTHEQARPIPLLYGKRRVSVTFLSQAFNQVNEVVKESTGGKFGQEVTRGYNYYADFAALVCHGPVDFISTIWFDDEKVWPDDGGARLERDEDNPVSAPIQIKNFGNWTFYWGTDDQGIDPKLAALADGVVASPNVAEDHPAYTGLCYLVASRQFLGFQRTNIQNIEVEVGRFPAKFFGVDGPLDSFLPADSLNINDDCNPAAILADMLLNSRYGLGLTETALNSDGFWYAAQAFQTEDFGLTVHINRQQQFKQTLEQLLEHVDGWVRDNAAGQITPGLARPEESVVNSIAPGDLIDPPQISHGGWAGTNNYLWLKYVNRTNSYKEDAVPGGDLANLQITGEPNTLTLDRPWVMRPEVADRLAIIAGKIVGVPPVNGRLRLRKSSASGLAPGGMFYLDYPQLNLANLVCRVTEMDAGDPYQPQVEVAFEADRHYLALPSYEPPAYEPPEEILNENPPVTHLRVMEWPGVNGDKGVLMVLAAKPAKMADGFFVYNVQNEQERQVAKGTVFAHHGVLTADYGRAETGKIALTFDSFPDEDIEPTEEDANNGRWLLFVTLPREHWTYNDTEYEYDGLEEIMSIYDREAVSGEPAKWLYSVKREWWDTGRYGHAMGAEFFLIRQDALRSSLGSDPFASGPIPFKAKASAFGILSNFPADPVRTNLGYLRQTAPWKPRNFKVNGSFEATWDGSGTGDFVLTWDLNRREGLPFKDSTTRFNWWFVEIVRPNNSTFVLPTDNAYAGFVPSQNSYTVSQAFVKNKTGAVTFKFRIYAKENMTKSLAQEVEVALV